MRPLPGSVEEPIDLSDTMICHEKLSEIITLCINDYSEETEQLSFEQSKQLSAATKVLGLDRRVWYFN